MELIRILPGNTDIHIIDKINVESFPVGERMDISLQLELCGEGRLDLMGIYDGDALVGFTTIFPWAGMDYVFFLAMDPSARSKGYGAKTLDMIKKRYPDDCVVLDIEYTGRPSEDHELRCRRRNFYLRNSFRSSSYLLTYCGMEFEVLFSGIGPFDRNAYLGVLGGISEMLVSKGIRGFEPRLVHIAQPSGAAVSPDK